MNKENIVLYVDDDHQNLDTFYYSFRRRFPILTVLSVNDAWEVLADNKVKVLVSDQRMPDESGLDFIYEVHAKYPDVVTILMTAYSETSIMLDAINRVGVFRYILKPWQEQEVLMTMQNAFEKYDWNVERKNLLDNLQEQNRKLLIEKSKAEESEKLIKAFLQNVSHEIRTPMNSILGFSDLLLNQSLNAAQKERYSSIVNGSCRNLLSVINDIILLSELQAGTYELFKEKASVKKLGREIEMICQQSLKLHKAEQLDVKINIPHNNDELELNFSAITAIAKRIIDNAVKFTSSGAVNINLILEDQSKTKLLLLVVEDEGEGIDPKYASKIFEPFFQICSESDSVVAGNGIGLSIVHELVTLMKSSISVKSESGKGTVVLFETEL